MTFAKTIEDLKVGDREMKPNPRGFTLIELLIVVAIIGIITAIAVPTLLNALDKGKQKRTMADIRSIGSAMESYEVDQGFYPRNYTSLVTIDNLAPWVEGPYLRSLPRTDGWGYSLLFASDAAGDGYTLRSPGKDGQTQAAFGETTEFDCDIIFQNGTFTAFPKGRQED
jgi:general secretion pathway protein G